MPPRPAYNWLCVLSSVADILGHAAKIRAAQIAAGASSVQRQPRTARDHAVSRADTTAARIDPIPTEFTSSIYGEALRPEPTRPEADDAILADTTRNRAVSSTGATATHIISPTIEIASSLYDETLQPEPRRYELASAPPASQFSQPPFTSEVRAGTTLDFVGPAPPNIDLPPYIEAEQLDRTLSQVADASLAPNVENPVVSTQPKVINTSPDPQDVAPFVTLPLDGGSTSESDSTPERPAERSLEHVVPSRNLQSSKVPSSRVGRLFHYGGLAASLGFGAASELLRRTSSGSEGGQSSVMMSEANIKRLVSKLSQMRGAALKLGQFMSIQDTHILPPDLDKIFRRVQDSAHYMPDWQMERVMAAALGSDWTTHFTSFDRVPFAAASIGQVHTATLAPASSPTGAPERVAVKIQFPNIADSIESDLGYIRLLLSAGRLLPKGLFLDRTMQVMKEELADECDYTREASFLRKFGSKAFLGSDPRFKVPWVWEGSTSRVLVMEHVGGYSVGEADAKHLETCDRNDIAARIIELCLKELFEFRLMQTDPNWTNFLWNPRTRQIELVDFGATREYTKAFMDDWLRLLQAAAAEDRSACIEASIKLGYLTGAENDIMLDAHVNSMILLAAPFRASTPQPFSFGQGTQWAAITAQIRAQIPVMLQHRLTPPPRETYSLNRKLSGAFLLASRLGASVDTKALWDRVVAKYEYTS